MLQMPTVAARWLAATQKPWSEADVEALYRRVTPMQVAAAAVHSALVPGVRDAVNALRAMKIRIAGSTGYFREAAEVCYKPARTQGSEPEYSICAYEVSAGRPKPWMIFRCMEALDVFPPRRVVKVGDTVVDVEDGLNAGVGSVAVVDSSSEIGLSQLEFAALSDPDRAARRAAVRSRFEAAGAEGILNSIADLPAFIAKSETVLVS